MIIYWLPSLISSLIMLYDFFAFTDKASKQVSNKNKRDIAIRFLCFLKYAQQRSGLCSLTTCLFYTWIWHNFGSYLLSQNQWNFKEFSIKKLLFAQRTQKLATKYFQSYGLPKYIMNNDRFLRIFLIFVLFTALRNTDLHMKLRFFTIAYHCQ